MFWIGSNNILIVNMWNLGKKKIIIQCDYTGVKIKKCHSNTVMFIKIKKNIALV